MATYVCWNWRLKLVGFLTLSGLLASGGNGTLAQIVPDNTLGTESSVVTPDADIGGFPADRIDGGALRGSNMFHSFSEFNVGEGQGVYFANPTGIENILTRVTGTNASNILGTLGVTGGNANLFLINPNGIVFGPNANLDVRGSFVATTANAIEFGTQGFFSASEPDAPPLLTVNPSAFFFNQIEARPIAVNSRRVIGFNEYDYPLYEGQRVPVGKSFLFLGGNLTLDGADLQAPASRVELGGIAGAGTVGLNVDGNNLHLSFPNGVTRADVTLVNGARVNVRAGDGGSIAINAQNLNMAGGSKLQAGIDSWFRSPESKAGDIEINATGIVNLTDNSSISNGVLAGGIGKGGDINITTGSLFGTNGARVTTNASGQGDAGSVTITTSDTVSFDGVSSNGLSSGIFSSVDRGGAGKGGDISVTTKSLLLTNGAVVSANTFARGDGGSIAITAWDTLFFDGVGSNGLSSGLLSGTRGVANGRGGDITVTTGVLHVAHGAVLSARTWNRYSGGQISVDANNLDLRDGGQLLTTAYSSGHAGNITVNAADGIAMSGSDPTFDARFAQFGFSTVDPADDTSGVFANTTLEATGEAGEIRITTGELTVQDEAQVAVKSQGLGNAGDLEVMAYSIHLDNKAVLSAETKAAQGNINLESQEVVLRRSAQITTNATGNAIGGNITVKSDVLAALENSDISANAQLGSGGRVIINIQGIFGTQSRDKPTPESDITATSDLGPEFSGVVQINAPDVDPSRGLAQLPINLVDATGLVDRSCPRAGGNLTDSSFTVIGRGGMPPSPTEALGEEGLLEDLGTPVDVKDEEQAGREIEPVASKDSFPNRIVEATGWVKNPNGQMVLVAQAPDVTPHSSRFSSPSCQSTRVGARG